MDTLLLHVCCGPCSTVPLSLLLTREVPFAAYFSNSNIDSKDEYELRLRTFSAYAEKLGVKVLTSDYEPDTWEEAIGSNAGVFPLVFGSQDYAENRKRREQRCRCCYAYRFEQLAKTAKQEGYNSISTTLSISPYQFTDVIEAVLAEAALSGGISARFEDYCAYYSQSVQMAREQGMYRQNYCGCRYSAREAELEREAKKSAKSAKPAKPAGENRDRGATEATNG